MDPQDDAQVAPGAYRNTGVYRLTSANSTPSMVLRPLSTGEVLDRTFTLYRRRFWLFVGIGTLPAAVLTLSALIRLLYITATHRPLPTLRGTPADALASVVGDARLSLYLLPVTFLFVVAYSVSHAAVVHAVAAITEGDAVTVESAYRAVRSRWLRWTGIAVRQFWAFFWPILISLVLLGFPLAFSRVRNNTLAVGALFLAFGIVAGAAFVFGVLNLLRVALAVPAGVQEGLGVSASVRRSRALVAGRKGRIFLLLLLVYALQLVASGVQVPLLLLAAMAHGGQQVVLQIIQVTVQFVATALVTPIASIALYLFYVDERVRREGYDIERLMHGNFGPTTGSALMHPGPAEASVGPAA